MAVSGFWSSRPVPDGFDAQTLTKMTIATGVDPAFSQFYVAKEAGCSRRTDST